jgi:lipopolysaccharide export system permease protein
LKTLHAYLTRQVLAALVLTVAVFAVILLLGSVLKEVVALLVQRQISVALVGQSLVLLLPYLLTWALPMGMLTATLLVFGRFSADQELTAARANGVSLLALVTPVLLIGVAVSLVCAWMTLEVGPRCRTRYREMLYQFGAQQATRFISDGQFIKAFRGHILYIGRKINDSEFRDVRLWSFNAADEVEVRLVAARARLTMERGGPAALELVEVQRSALLGGLWQRQEMGELTLPLDVGPVLRVDFQPKLSDMTFRQLWAEREEKRRLGVEVGPIETHLHRQLAFSFASLGFTLVGIPLGLRAHRRETSLGVAIAVLLVLVYYSFIITGQALEQRPELRPHLIIWFPNFLFQAVGGWLLWRFEHRV